MKGFIEVTDYSGGSGFPYGRIERTQNASENLLPRKRNQK